MSKTYKVMSSQSRNAVTSQLSDTDVRQGKKAETPLDENYAYGHI